MINKILHILMIVMIGIFCLSLSFSVEARERTARYNRQLSRSEKAAICTRLQNVAQTRAEDEATLGGGIIPDEAIISIFNTTRNISDSLKLISSLGDALMCHAVHAAKNRVKIFGVELFSYPDIPIWLCGAIIYCFGFMFVLSVTFYIVDISFKLGFAIILMPIGVALWPFEKTKDKLTILISIFLKAAAIFPFLAITVAYSFNMLSEALGSEGMTPIFEAITNNDTDYIADVFSIGSGLFIIILTVLIYGMKLISSTINEYVDKFFPDKAFGSASPMHHMATQAVDFAKQKAIAPVAKYAADVAATQAGKVTEKAGKMMQGQYHDNFKNGIRNIGRAVRNPREMAGKLGAGLAHKKDQLVNSRTFNNLKYGAQIAKTRLPFGADRDARKALRQDLRNERNQKNDNLQETQQKIDNNYQNKLNQLNANIDAHEQNRQAEKQQKHEDRMMNDPAYRQRVENRTARQMKRADRREQRVERRDTRIGQINAKLKGIDEKIKSKLIDKQNVYNSMNNFANRIKSNKPTARALDAVENSKQNAYKKIDNGRFAKHTDDKGIKRAGKALMRGIEKSVVAAGYLVPQAPLSAVSAVSNMAVNTANVAAKAVTAVAMNVSNGAVRAYFGAQKIIPNVRKAFIDTPNTARNALNVPGKIVESVGQAMQDHRPKKS